MRGWNLCVVYHHEIQTVASRGLLQTCFMLCDVAIIYYKRWTVLLRLWFFFSPLKIFIRIYLELKQLLKSPEYWQVLIVFLSFRCCFGPADLIINTFLKVRVKTFSCKSLQLNIQYTVNTNIDFCMTYFHVEKCEIFILSNKKKKKVSDGQKLLVILMETTSIKHHLLLLTFVILTLL